ncbi:MAG: osmotically inducible protein C [Candidatus Cloacimonas sp. 4484_140]|nr:MAG: osmotically inducible protein C [Candidatus Cloacimonas sp. 4484_140]
MKAKVTLIDKLQFSAVSDSNHAIILDAGKDMSYDQGCRPKELVLMGLIGCTGMDVASLLRKMRVPFKDITISADAEISTEHPKIFTKIHIIYTIIGDNIDESKVEKAITLSHERYCGVTTMLQKSAKITNSYNIEKEKQGE